MRRSIRIGIDARLYSQTGVGRYIQFLIEELGKIDKRNQYVLFTMRTDFADLSLPGANFSKKIANVRWHSINEQLTFPIILLKENLDLVHFPYFSLPIVYPKPFVVTIHDLTPLTHPTGQASTLPLPLYRIKHLGYRLVLSQAIKRSSHIIVPSQATRDELLHHFPGVGKKITITHEGVKTTKVTKNKPLVEGKYFLYVGNAYPHKNVELLIKAFEKLNSNIKLVLVGQEDYFYQRLRDTLNQEKQNIVFFGPAKDAQLANLYSCALALILPSLSEGFGLPAVEAMAYGCLVMAASIPALKEVCGNVAFYVDPRDEWSIARAMRQVYHNRAAFRTLIRRGKKRAKMFSWDKMASQTLSIYESCLGLRSSR